MVSAKRKRAMQHQWQKSASVLLKGIVIMVFILGSLSCNQPTETNLNSDNAKTAGASTSSPNVSLRGGPKSNVPTLPAPLPEAVKNAEIQTLDGERFRLADYAGKVVVLDLWATWCPPCREEIPHLVEISKKYKDQGVEVIGLDVDASEPVDDVRDFADEFKINYKLGYAERDFALALMGGGPPPPIPQTLVISRDGRIVNHFIGFHPQRTSVQLREAVERAVRSNDKGEG